MFFSLPYKNGYLDQLTHNVINHFFSIQKLNFNLILCKMVVVIIIYIRKIFIIFSSLFFNIILYLNDKFNIKYITL
jgi:hypothetical protein